METVKLNNGVEMPVLGYGVYQVNPGECERCVADALSVGYRMVDTAQAYHNEEGVGAAVKKSGIPRQELFLVSKVWISNAGYEKAKASIETHVFNQQRKPQEIMKSYGTQIMSWGPFAEGRNGFFSNPVLQRVGAEYGKSVAQVALRFLIQRGVVVIPKSTHKERMVQNLDVFDFMLSEEDMAAIARLDKAESLFFSHYDPETVKFLVGLGK